MYGLQVSMMSLNLAYCFVFLAIAGVFFAFVQKANLTKQQRNYKDDTKDSFYPPIEPLPHFDWKSEDPVKIRPFKPKYHLTMGIQEIQANDLIKIDKNYLDRIRLRRQIMHENPEITLAADGCVKPAVDEFYTWLTSTYLPQRFPTIFQLRQSQCNMAECLYNIATDEEISLKPADYPLDSLRTLGGLIEDDLLFLLPSDDGDGLKLRGLVTCFPNGFNTAKKLNLKLRDIHTPVPQYKAKLEKSMDRFFEKLEPGRFITRANWTIQPTEQLFTASGNHLYEGDEILPEVLDIRKARMRVERQVLHKLPHSRAVLFSFKTLLYTLSEIREEGLGPDLAQAIDGLQQGNAPGFHFYKKAAVWGESAKTLLQS